MRARPDLLVLGGGAVGLFTALAAARRGARVRLLERLRSPNAESSHHGETRMIRCAYFEHPDYVALALTAWRLWEEFDRAHGGAPVLHATGGVYLGAPDGELVAGARAAAERHDLPHACWDAAALKAQLPQFEAPVGALAVREERAGFLLCEEALRRAAAACDAAGVERIEGAEVRALEVDADGAPSALSADGARHAATAVADARGPGMAAAGLPWSLRTTRQALGWFAPAQPAACAPGRLPVWACDAAIAGESGGGIFYGFPLLPGASAVKAARHVPGAPAPPHGPLTPASHELDDVARALRRILPAAAGPLLRAEVCRYTMSADGHFLLDRHPSGARGAACAGLSGHGFKFAPVLGQALAELALDGATTLPVAFLRADRPGGCV